MTWHWPQFVYAALTAMALGFKLALNGQPQSQPHSFGWSLFSAAVCAYVLHVGGFW